MPRYKGPTTEQVAAGLGVCAAVAGTAYCLHQYVSTPNTLPMAALNKMDIEHQAIDVPDVPGAKRSAFSEELMDSYDGVTTVYEAYLKGAEIAGDKPCLGTQSNGSYTWMTYNEVLERAAHLGSGIIELGYKPSPDTFVGIYAGNKTELIHTENEPKKYLSSSFVAIFESLLKWVLTDVACQTYSMVSVPLYDSLGADACSYIINHADVSVIVCDANKLDNLLEKAAECPKLKHIIKIGDVSDEDEQRAGKFGITVKSFTDMLKLGRDSPKEKSPGKPDDVFTVCFTSGTTGQPKGAMLTNRNLTSNIAAFRIHFEQNGRPMVSSDVHISYLPLPHMYERICQVAMRSAGGSSGFFRGDIKLLLDDIQLLRPTFFPSVPRLLNRLYDKVTAGVESSGGLKKWLFNKAFASKKADLENGQIYNNGFWDILVFRKIQAILGGNVALIGTGAAPIEGKVLTFLKVCFGCLVVEGYGQTESTSLGTLTNAFDFSSGHVGPPAVCNYVKLVDVPEMEYYTSKNQGEVCMYGPNVFKGYLKAPEKTAETIDKDGWLHTGDVGEWNTNGTLKIIGRKKCIFKLSQGEYVAPDKIENIYLKSPFVAQAFVHGYSIKSCVVGVIVPDEEVLMNWAKENDPSATFEELCKNEDVKGMILRDIIARGKEAKLASFEQVKIIHLHPELFSIENGLLTPTLKSKRFTMQKRFTDEIDKLYEKLEQIAQPKL